VQKVQAAVQRCRAVQLHCRQCSFMSPSKSQYHAVTDGWGEGRRVTRSVHRDTLRRIPNSPAFEGLCILRPRHFEGWEASLKNPALPALQAAILHCHGSAAALPPAPPRQCRSAVSCSLHCRQCSCTDFLRAAVQLHCRGSAGLPLHCRPCRPCTAMAVQLQCPGLPGPRCTGACTFCTAGPSLCISTNLHG
jgi:hypothetical protein